MTKPYKNEALEELDIEYTLADAGVDYKMAWGRSGRQLNVRECPFCGNNKYKVYINAATGLGNCFAGSCSQGTFNKWQYLKALYNLNNAEMYTKINDLAIAQGWRPKEKPVKFDPGPLNLPPNTPCNELPAMPRYLLDRGITGSIASHFDLRYADSGSLFKVKDPSGKTIIQDYSNRIIIPIYDLAGEMVSFQGRDATGKAEKRYLFPPMYSSTGSQLYNIQNWKEGMNAVVITEGPFDAVGVHRSLLKYAKTNMLATASFGMSFSESKEQDDQINRLLELKARGLETVYFLWDNEPKALAAAIKACRKVLRYGFKPMLAVLPTSKDPGDAPESEVMQALDNAYEVSSDLKAMILERKLLH